VTLAFALNIIWKNREKTRKTPMTARLSRK